MSLLDIWSRPHLFRCLGEQQPKQPLGFGYGLLGQNDGFILVDRVPDETLLMEAVHCLKVKALSRPAALVEDQVE